MWRKKSTYVTDMDILDSPLVVNEVVLWANKRKEKFILLKVDYDKAFDSISWRYMMTSWNRWILALHAELP